MPNESADPTYTETVVYSDLPEGCSAVVLQNDKEVNVVLRREGQPDWVVWAGRKGAAE